MLQCTNFLHIPKKRIYIDYIAVQQRMKRREWEMAMTIDSGMIRRPTGLTPDGVETAFERTAEPPRRAAFPPSMMKGGMITD